MRSATLHLRLSQDERQALDELATSTGLTASAIARAGLREVLADPALVVGVRAPAAGRPEASPPPSPRRRGRRGRGR